MSEQMDFNDGKYTVISDNGRLTALRNGEPWNRDITGDNLIYWMLVEAIRLKEERDASAAKLANVEGQLAAVERLRPMWAQGHSTDSVAAQVSAAALTSLWDLLGVGNQTSAVVKLKQLLRVSAERDALAAKLAELEGQPPVAYANGDALDNMLDDRVCVVLGSKDSFHRTPVFRRQIPAEQPVNARLLGALSALLDDIEGLIGESSGVYGLHLNGDVSPWSELEEGGRFERLSSMSSAREAIAAAESAPKAVRLTDEEVASLLADSDKNSLRVPSFFMVEPHKFARAIESAVLAKNGIEVAE